MEAEILNRLLDPSFSLDSSHDTLYTASQQCCGNHAMEPDYQLCLLRQAQLIDAFKALLSAEDRYSYILKMGRSLPRVHHNAKTPALLVPGCQSEVYMYAEVTEERLHFFVTTDALISAGLAAILLYVYDKLAPQVLLTCPPDMLEHMGIYRALSPARSNGIVSIHQQMKYVALKHLTGGMSYGTRTRDAL